MMMLSSLLFCLSFSLIVASPTSSLCTTTEYMKSCSLQSNAETLKVFGDELLVGTANALLSYGLDLQQRVIVNLTSNALDLKSCTNDDYSPEDCKNFIKVIEPIPSSDKILVCGTNSYFPKCTLHNKNNLTNFTRLSSDATEDIGYSPHSNKDFIISLVTSNKRFFTATRFILNGAQTTIGMSPNPLLGENRFTVRVSASTNGKLLNLPIRYISAHEYGDYVYFFITESSLELVQKVSDMTSKRQYTRAIRICKADNGIGNVNPELNRFVTFQKARMECKVGQDSSYDYVYYYDHLKSTFVGHQDGSPVLYGTFNSPSNGPKGGAICKFSFPGSLTSVFEDGNYNVRTEVDDRYVWTKETTQPFTCNSTRTVEDANKYDFVYNPVSSGPLFVSEGEFLEKIAAETVTYNGDVQEVLFYSNQLGQVKQVVLSSANPGESFVHTIIMDSDTNGKGDIEKVQKLILQSETGGARSLYVSRGRKIMQIYRGRCDRYIDCQGCLTSRDPYCAWKSETAACVNKVTENSIANLTQSFSASTSVITRVCMISTDSPVFTDSSSASNSEQTVTNHNTIITPIVEDLDPARSAKKVSIIIVLGASMGAFVGGLLIGLVIFCSSFICKKRISSTRKSFDVHDGKNRTSSTKSYEVHDCIAGASNAAMSSNTESVLVQARKDDLNNSSRGKVLDKNPSPVRIDLALKPTPPPRYVDHALQSHQRAPPQPVTFPTNVNNSNITHTSNCIVNPSTNINNTNVFTCTENCLINPLANINDNHISKRMENGIVNSPAHIGNGHIPKHLENGLVNPPANIKISTHVANAVAVASSNTLPERKRSNTKNENKFNFSMNEESEDSAFRDTVPPLKSFPSTSSVYDSMKGHRCGEGSNGITSKQVPKHKIPHGRTSSTVWLRESSVSSDVSIDLSPLQSPISDV